MSTLDFAADGATDYSKKRKSDSLDFAFYPAAKAALAARNPAEDGHASRSRFFAFSVLFLALFAATFGSSIFAHDLSAGLKRGHAISKVLFPEKSTNVLLGLEFKTHRLSLSQQGVLQVRPANRRRLKPVVLSAALNGSMFAPRS